MDRLNEAIKKRRLNISFSGVIVILLGILLVVDAANILKTMAWIVGLLFVIVGVTQFIGKLMSDVNKSSGMLMGGLIAVLGIWIMIRPELVGGLFPMVIGIILVVHGIQGISLAVAGRSVNMEKWGLLLLGSILNIAGGVFCVVYSFTVGVIALKIVGLFLIYDGVVSIIGANTVNYYEKQSVIDAESWEINDEE